MTNKIQSLTSILNCAPLAIPPEYKEKATALAAKFTKDYTLTGLIALDYELVYNHVCFHIRRQLNSNPDFSPRTFSTYINEKTLFYGYDDIQTLVQHYCSDPNSALPIAICYFAKKFKSVKRKMISYTKELDMEEIDEVLVWTTHRLLLSYDPEVPFSFAYLDLELRAALLTLAGEYFPVKLPRNDLMNYFKFCGYIEKYTLTATTINIFLEEVNLSEEELALHDDLYFAIDEQDRQKPLKITLSKAMDYYHLYVIMRDGVDSYEYYDEEADRYYDLTEGKIDPHFVEAELHVMESQILTDENDKRIYRRFMETGSASFSNDELKSDYNYSRYSLHLLRSHLRDNFVEKTSSSPKKKRGKNYTPIE